MDYEILKKYAPPVVSFDAIVSCFIANNIARKSITDAYYISKKSYEKYRRKTIPNNKLKMLGEPMRRRGH